MDPGALPAVGPGEPRAAGRPLRRRALGSTSHGAAARSSFAPGATRESPAVSPSALRVVALPRCRRSRCQVPAGRARWWVSGSTSHSPVPVPGGPCGRGFRRAGPARRRRAPDPSEPVAVRHARPGHSARTASWRGPATAPQRSFLARGFAAVTGGREDCRCPRGAKVMPAARARRASARATALKRPPAPLHPCPPPGPPVVPGRGGAVRSGSNRRKLRLRGAI